MDFETLYENNKIIVFNKPVGVETISAQLKIGSQCMTAQIQEKWGEEFYPAHRLDRDTSGVMLFGKTKKIAQHYTEFFRTRQVKKSYLALCWGKPSHPQGTIKRNLSKWEGGKNPVRTLPIGKGVTATTDYICLDSFRIEKEKKWVSLMLFLPHEGRTHQIRVHAQSISLPLLGDDQYGARELNRVARTEWGLKYQALHALRLQFEGITVDAPPPHSWENILRLFSTNYSDLLSKNL